MYHQPIILALYLYQLLITHCSQTSPQAFLLYQNRVFSFQLLCDSTTFQHIWKNNRILRFKIVITLTSNCTNKIQDFYLFCNHRVETINQAQCIKNQQVIQQKLYNQLADQLNQIMYLSIRQNRGQQRVFCQQKIMSTKVTSNSVEMKAHLPIIIQQIMGKKIMSIRRQQFNRLKQRKAYNQLGITQRSQNNLNLMPKQMLMFANHCATMIQSNFRGYRQRKYYKMFRPLLRRFKELMSAAVAGWRVRRVMQSKHVIKRRQKIQALVENKNYRQARISKRDLIDDINSLLAKGKWIEFCQQQRKNKQKLKIKLSRINLRSALDSNNRTQNSKQIKQSKLIKNEKLIDQQAIQASKHEQSAQIPIKSTGFYNIPQAQPTLDPNITKPYTKKINKPISNSHKNIKLNKAQQKLKQQKQIQQNKATVKKQNNCNPQSASSKSNKKMNQSDCIVLPLQEISCTEVNYNWNRTNKQKQAKVIIQDGRQGSSDAQISGKPVSSQLKRLKIQRKGIKVTLCENISASESNMMKPNEQSKLKTNVKPEVNEQLISGLDEIEYVYQHAYTAKKNEIKDKLTKMPIKKYTK